MQTQGSLQESDLASLLETMQSERATGALTLAENGTAGASLFFLFGHLFHATDPSGDGEEVVVRALGWRDGTFRFDPRAKLPAEETIRSSPAELVVAAGQAGGPAPSSPDAMAVGTPSLRAHEGHADGDDERAPDAAAWNPSAILADPAGHDGSDGQAGAAATSGYLPSEYSPTYVPAEPAPVAGGAVAGGATTIAPLGTLPMPAGSLQYAGLKSAFIDFPRLLRTLRADGHTGFIRLVAGASCGVLLFRDGEVVEAEAGEDGAAHGEQGFRVVRDHIERGEGLLDVVTLDAETVSSLARLFAGPALFTGLVARFVNFSALLEHLAEQRLDGSVIVVGGSETGVILLRDGTVRAAYTAAAPEAQASTDAVATLAAEPGARIDVRGDGGGGGTVDTEAALSRPS